MFEVFALAICIHMDCAMLKNVDKRTPIPLREVTHEECVDTGKAFGKELLKYLQNNKENVSKLHPFYRLIAKTSGTPRIKEVECRWNSEYTP